MSTEHTFTLDEAQALLPTLRDLLESARAAHQRGQEIDRHFQALISRILLSGGIQSDPVHTSRLRNEREECGQKFNDATEEIGSTGAQLKDIDLGLLDFPCWLRGEMVLLCWKLGEEAIEHWHGVQEGFANRKPLDRSMFPSGQSPHVH